MSTDFKHVPPAATVTSNPPGAPGSPAVWTSGAKDGIGTAFFDPSTRESHSNVWFTLSKGVLTEVYYPDVSQANIKLLQFIVTDGKSFTDFEMSDTFHETKLATYDALIYQQTNTAKNGKYQIEKTYITNPNSHTVVIDVVFRAIVGTVKDYNVYVYLNPILSNTARNDSVHVISHESATYLVGRDDNTAVALTASTPFMRVSCGYVGVSDGAAELREQFGLTSFFNEAGPGNVALIGQLDLSVASNQYSRFTLCLGFSASEDGAIADARATLCQPYSALRTEYQRGWQSYIRNLRPPVLGNPEQYYAAAMVVKAHEDKLHPGAMVASLTIPWGQGVRAEDTGVGGYHLVWSRDLYHAATALIAIGDIQTARRALAYLDEISQTENGCFPQNSWLDGRPYWTGVQLDQVAYPILLASQLGETSRYHSLVKPAADFIVNYGPVTAQERWEENAGYSPSTLAAVIAGLVAAAKLAQENEAYADAAIYLRTADEWANHVETWTVARTGSLAKTPYYIRISDTDEPDDGHFMDIKNGSGWHPKAEVIDAGFLELVRLGIKSPDDAIITNSINVIDKFIKYDTPFGPTWYRYNHDGYGEKCDGSPYNGEGFGRPWPHLTGERGEYEIALAASSRKSSPECIYGPDHLLQVMASCANSGYMIPEQIWDDSDIPLHDLRKCGGTGSATPLVWAMAQYLRLAACIEQGCVVEMPLEVKERYLTNPPPVGPFLDIISPAGMIRVKDADVVVRGRTCAHATVVLRSAKRREGQQPLIVTSADENGDFLVKAELTTVGEQTVEIIAFDNIRSWTSIRHTLVYEPRMLLEMMDLEDEDCSSEGYVYPTHPVFQHGDFDLQGIRVSADDDKVYFEIKFGHLDNPWHGPSGISKQLIDIYLDTGVRCASKQHLTMGLNAQFQPNAAWNKLIRVTGNWLGEAHVYNGDWSNAGAIEIEARYALNTVVVIVPILALDGPVQNDWGLMVVVAGEEYGKARAIRPSPSEWHFGGGREDGVHPYIIDMLVPHGVSKSGLLEPRGNNMIELPMIRFPG